VPGVLNFFEEGGAILLFEEGGAILLCLANNWDPNSELHSQLHWLERIEFQFVDNRVAVEGGRPDWWPAGHFLAPFTLHLLSHIIIGFMWPDLPRNAFPCNC
jgi:hypothetical protein